MFFVVTSNNINSPFLCWPGYLGYDVFAFLLMSVSESAIFVVIVEALVTPISGVFWFLFDYTKNDQLIFSPFW